jgi:hypothetical protein
MNGSALLKGEGSVAVGLRAEKGSHLVEQATEARRRDAVFEPAHRPIPRFNPAMILFQVVIQVAIRAMLHVIPEDMAYGARVGVVAIRGDAVRYHAGARPGGTEECLRRGEVAGVTEAHVHQISVSINRPVEGLPPTVNPHLRLIDVPTGSHRAVSPFAQGLAQQGGQLALPIPYRFMCKADAPLEKHLRQVSQAQLVPMAPQHHETDYVGRILQMVEYGACPFIERPLAIATTKAAIA